MIDQMDERDNQEQCDKPGLRPEPNDNKVASDSYYYDDATGYELYEDDEEEDEPESH